MTRFVEATWATDRGRVRPTNEDAAAILVLDWDSEAAAIAVADGMGGHRAGDIASATVVDGLRRHLCRFECDLDALGPQWQIALSGRLIQAIGSINKDICASADEDASHTGMGSTLVLILFVRGWYCVLHVGDSRAYRLRNGTLTQLTIDHSWSEEQRSLGTLSKQQIVLSPLGLQLTRALGQEDGAAPTVLWDRAEPGDILLACSDGLIKYLDGPDLARALAEPGGLRERATHLVAEANRRGGADNVTVALAQFNGSVAPCLPDPDTDTAPRADLAVAIRQRPRVYSARSEPPPGAPRRLALLALGSALVLTTSVFAWASHRYLTTGPRQDTSVPSRSDLPARQTAKSVSRETSTRGEPERGRSTVPSTPARLDSTRSGSRSHGP
jgi:PPM family protein phosphatase